LFVRANPDGAICVLTAFGQIVHDARDVLERAIVVDIGRKDILTETR